MPTPLESARDTLATRERELQAIIDDAEAANTAHSAALQTLGSEPRVRKEPSEPVAPNRTRPTPEALAAAQALVKSYPAAKALHDAYTTEKVTRDARVTETATAQTEAEAVAGRVSATLVAAKAAPSAIAAEMVELLQLPEGIGVTFPDYKKNGPAISIALDGRPWTDPGTRRYLGHSSGREVVGDLLFRATLRRLAGERLGKVWAALPIGVDDSVLLDAGGALPDVGGCLVVLRTTASGDLGVAGV